MSGLCDWMSLPGDWMSLPGDWMSFSGDWVSYSDDWMSAPDIWEPGQIDLKVCPGGQRFVLFSQAKNKGQFEDHTKFVKMI